jgi:hypothetical protein
VHPVNRLVWRSEARASPRHPRTDVAYFDRRLNYPLQLATRYRAGRFEKAVLPHVLKGFLHVSAISLADFEKDIDGGGAILAVAEPGDAPVIDSK